MNEEDLKRLAESLNRLSGDSDELAEKLKQNLATQDTYTKAISKTNETIDKEILARLKSNAALIRGEQAYEQQLRSLGLTKNALGEFERATVQLTSEQRKRIAEEEVYANKQKAREEMRANYDRMLADKSGTLLKGLTDLGAGLNKTLFDSTKGQSKYGEMMGGFGDGIIKATSSLGPFGQAIGLAAGGLLKLAGAAFKQQEQLNKAYENLSEVGAVDAKGIAGMFDNLQKMGFTVAEIDKFQNVIKKASPNLATLGTTVADGAKIFADSMGAIKNTGVERELRNLGFTSDAMAKTFADYQGMMGRQGLLQGKSVATIAKESANYAKTLDELSKLTGQSRDELQARADAAANDIRFRLKMQELDRSGRVEDQKAAEQARKAIQAVGVMSEDTQSGFREMVANNGKVVGEASAKLMLSTGNAAEGITKRLLAGTITGEQAAVEIAEAKQKQIERFREVGKLDAEIMRELGITVEDMDGSMKLAGKSQEEIAQLLKDQKDQGSGELDAQRSAETKRQMTERNFEQAKDRLTNVVGNILVKAFEKLMQVMNTVGKALAEFAYKISFGAIDVRDAFKSTEDMGKDLHALAKDIKNVDEQIKNQQDAAKRRPTIATEITAQEGLLALLKNNIEKETNSAKKTEMQNQLADAEKRLIELKQYKKSLDANQTLGSPEQLENLRKQRQQKADEYNKQSKEYQAAGGEVLQQSAPATGSAPTQTSGMGTYLQKVAQVESGGKAGEQAKTSSAAGLFQFTKGTWNQMVKQMGKSYTEEDRFDPVKATEVAKFFTEQQSKSLKDALGREPNDTEKYMAHFLGAGGAIKFLKAMAKNPTGPATEGANSNQIEANKPIFYTEAGKGKLRTLEEVYGLMSSKLDKAENIIASGKGGQDLASIQVAQLGGMFSGPSSGYPVMLHGKELVIPMNNAANIKSILNSVDKKSIQAGIQENLDSLKTKNIELLKNSQNEIPNPNLGQLIGDMANKNKEFLTTQTQNQETSNNQTSNTTSQNNFEQILNMQQELMNMLASKLDNLDFRLSKSNDIQENILTYSSS